MSSVQSKKPRSNAQRGFIWNVLVGNQTDSESLAQSLPVYITPSNRIQRCFREPDRITGCFRMTKGPAVRVGLIAYTASEQSQGCLSTLQGSWQREDTRPVITKAACELKAEKGSRLYERLDSLNTNLVVIGTKLVVGQKSRRVLRLNQDSGPYMARHEKRTRTVGIQHGKSRRYV